VGEELLRLLDGGVSLSIAGGEVRVGSAQAKAGAAHSDPPSKP
jgi:hypothetical protein